MDGSSEVALALVGLAGLAVKSHFDFMMVKRQMVKSDKAIGQVNDAVNHRHERGDGTKLYDMVFENTQSIKSLSKSLRVLSDNIGECPLIKSSQDEPASKKDEPACKKDD